MSSHPKTSSNFKKEKNDSLSSWDKVEWLKNGDSSSDSFGTQTNQSPRVDGGVSLRRFKKNLMSTFGLFPMEDKLALKKCSSCERILLSNAHSAHQGICPKLNPISENQTQSRMNRRLSSSSSRSDFSYHDSKIKTLAGNESFMSSESKSLDLNSPEGSFKSFSVKGDSSIRNGFHSSKLNLDTHCGVLLLGCGNRCDRPLTCKLHSVLEKKNVKGRSRPFYYLLKELFDIKRRKRRGHSELTIESSKSDEDGHDIFFKTGRKSNQMMEDDYLDKAVKILSGQLPYINHAEAESLLSSSKVVPVCRIARAMRLRQIFLTLMQDKISAVATNSAKKSVGSKNVPKASDMDTSSTKQDKQSKRKISTGVKRQSDDNSSKNPSKPKKSRSKKKQSSGANSAVSASPISSSVSRPKLPENSDPSTLLTVDPSTLLTIDPKDLK